MGTHYGAAQFLEKVDTDSVWNALLKCWVLVYAGMPDIFFCDQGSVFTSKKWEKLSEENGVMLKFSGTQHHNGLAIVERYHAPLRTIYRRVKIECPELGSGLILQSAVKAMNDTVGPEGLVPSLLVYGIPPRYTPAGLSPMLLDQRQRHEAIRIAREEFFRISNKLRISRALNAKVPESADRIFKEGDLVRVYREELKSYSNPVPIISLHESNRMATVQMRPGLQKLYSITQLKPYNGPNENSNEWLKSIDQSFGPWRSNYRARDEPVQTHITEVISKNDPRCNSTKMKTAIQKEIEGLLNRGTFKIVLKSEMPPNANVMGGRFVLAIKDPETKEERYKARFVVQGYNDKDKFNLVHASPNLRQDSMRLLFAIASIMGFELWSEDICLAYIQGSTEIMREIFVCPKGELSLQPNQIFQLMKPLYGLADSGDRWHYTLKKHMLDDLKMIPAKGDPSLYTKHICQRLTGIAGVYVDDLIQAGDPEFREFTKRTAKRFDSKPRTYQGAKFMGMEFSQKEDRSSIQLSMNDYIKKLELLPVPCEFNQIRSVRAKLAWTTNCRPDVSCAVAQSTQITMDSFKKIEDSKRLNKIIRHLKNHELRINIIGYRSYKCRRVTRSAMASECHALADAFDYSFMLKFDLESMLQQEIPLQIFTDSRSLFDVIVKATKTSERRLMIDVAACREAYERHEIADIGLIRSEHNLADCFTKVMLPVQLMIVMATAKLNHPVE
eukprot:IDg8498t1